MPVIEDVVNKESIKEVITPYIDQRINEIFSVDELRALMRERLALRLDELFGLAPQMTNGATSGDEDDEPTEAGPPQARQRRSSGSRSREASTANRMPAIIIPSNWMQKGQATPKYSDAAKQLMSFNPKQQEFIQAAARGENEFYPKVWGKVSRFFKGKDGEGKLRQALADYGMNAPQNGKTETQADVSESAAETEAAE